MRLHAKTGSPDVSRRNDWNDGPLRTIPQEPWHPGKGAKPDCVIQLDCVEMRTHASYKTTKTWENFNNPGTKMILLSDERRLIVKTPRDLRTGVSE